VVEWMCSEFARRPSGRGEGIGLSPAVFVQRVACWVLHMQQPGSERLVCGGRVWLLEGSSRYDL
jgi:hypothetical protein